MFFESRFSDRSRRAGVLLHISSLPSCRHGIGDLGPNAHAFAETLAAAGLEYWQFLPLTPTSAFIGSSPYSSPSAFAGNPLFISPDAMLADGLITWLEVEDSLTRIPPESAARVNYPEVQVRRDFLLELAFQRQRPSLEHQAGFTDFVTENASWLEDWAMFAAIKLEQRGAAWTAWPAGLKNRQPEALAAWRWAHAEAVLKQQFVQYLFDTQWKRLRERCRRLGLKLVGDLPIYVTHDSADVWARPDLFKLDERGRPLAVAGVPPDYFSATGQRWGNPVYDWEKMRAENFAWWIKRMRRNLELADVVRMDHFRGFCAYWEIPQEEKTAINGKWVKAPGRELFAALLEHFGELPIIAEDLGVITPDVCALKERFSLPGMKVLQFAFGGNLYDSPDIPYRHPENSVVYTGSHDNPPSKQWFAEAPEQEKGNFITYRGQDLDPDYANEVLMRLALESRAFLAILPMQDILRLGAESRMNTPSIPQGNWEWKMLNTEGWLDKSFWSDAPARATLPEATAPAAEPAPKVPVPNVFGHIHFLCGLYGRLQGKTPAEAEALAAMEKPLY